MGMLGVTGRVALSKTKLVAASVEFTAGEFNFTDVSVTTQAGQTNTVTMPHGGTLAIVSSGTSESGGAIYKNGVAQTIWQSQAYAELGNPSVGTGFWAYTAQWSIITVSSGDQVYFYYGEDGSPFENSFTVTIRNATFSGTIIDTHTWTKSASCFLTTAVVGYMGGKDDGAELTAMRMLREHYRAIDGYEAAIQDYYIHSPRIVTEIDKSPNRSDIYRRIHAVVKRCESHVAKRRWQSAHDEYMAMYIDLKERFIR
jgi:hypothetical protein